jgi:hypothetical protein
MFDLLSHRKLCNPCSFFIAFESDLRSPLSLTITPTSTIIPSPTMSTLGNALAAKAEAIRQRIIALQKVKPLPSAAIYDDWKEMFVVVLVSKTVGYSCKDILTLGYTGNEPRAY